MAQAKLEELEAEFRAQIEATLAAQLKPTHLDWHCLRFGGAGYCETGRYHSCGLSTVTGSLESKRRHR
jgi:hypothetical protein